jgi:phthalate 4,5-dioxygenase oxygenase subunit
VTPPGVDPAHQRVRSASVVLPKDEAFIDKTRDALVAVAGVGQSSV